MGRESWRSARGGVKARLRGAWSGSLDLILKAFQGWEKVFVHPPPFTEHLPCTWYCCSFCGYWGAFDKGPTPVELREISPKLGELMRGKLKGGLRQ